jgi:hypothetical protein
LLASFFALVIVAGLLGISRPAAAEPVVLQVDMYGSQETPPVATKAWGFVRFFFNDDRSAADYTVDVKGLATGLVLGADIHRGEPGESGPVVKALAEGGFIVTSGRLRLSRDDLIEMADGLWYVSLKTVDHPDGELRGQIILPAGFISRGPEGAPAGSGAPSGVTITPPDTFDPNDPSHPPSGIAPEPPPGPPSPAAPPAPGVIRPPSTGDAGLR